uniref:Riboflavin transporter n=1 Tax=Glossina palpalis gambiensis TaxID=67801 RepID=A0A1B0C4N1_9MUSC
MERLLLRYRSRQLYDVERLHNCKKMEKRKPDPNKNHPDDDCKIEEAQRTLKSSESSSVDESSSEGEEDTKSIDSTDMTAIRLDESHCPPGVERISKRKHLERETATLLVKTKPLQIHDGTEEMTVEKITMPSDTIGVCPEKKAFGTRKRVKAKPLQIHDGTEEMAMEKITMPSDTIGVCPEMSRPETVFVRMVADDFAADRCQNIVQKLFVHRFGKSAGQDNVRRSAYKVTSYLGQAAYSFEGELTDKIMECIAENIRTLIPNKYIVLVTHENLKKMFTEILSVFDYERSEFNTEDVVCTVYENAKETLQTATEVLNTAQYLLVHMVKELIEILPIEELLAETIVNAIVDNLEKQPYFDGRCINLEGLVSKVIQFAQKNLLDSVTSIPIRVLAQNWKHLQIIGNIVVYCILNPSVGNKLHIADVLRRFYTLYRRRAPFIGVYAWLKSIELMLDLDTVPQILVVNADHLKDRSLYNNIFTWTLLIGLMRYIKLTITTVMHSQGGKSLVWIGCVVQVRSSVLHSYLFS